MRGSVNRCAKSDGLVDPLVRKEFAMSESYHLGELSPLVIEEVARLYELRAPARMRAHDHTFWVDNPAEISDRLNWLTLPEDMATLAQAFVNSVNRPEPMVTGMWCCWVWAGAVWVRK